MLLKTTLALAVLAAVAGAPSAAASTLYSVQFPTTTDLFTIDQGSGALTSLGSTGVDGIGDPTSATRTGMFTLWGIRISDNELITLDPTDGSVLTAVNLGSDDAISNATQQLIEINKATGAGLNTLVGPHGSASKIVGPAFSDAEGPEASTGSMLLIGTLLLAGGRLSYRQEKA